MPNPASFDTLVSRLRSTNWSDPNEMAQAIASCVSGIVQLQLFNRGVHDNKIVDGTGGTTLAVGDNSIARPSVSLQPPQLGFTRKHGAVSTRTQRRAEADVKTVPCMVVAVTGDGENTTMDVVIIGDKPVIEVDPTSGQNKAGNILSQLNFDSDQIQATDATKMTITMPGVAFVDPDDEDSEGPKPPEIGQTVMITLARSVEKTTLWNQRGRRIVPRVHSNEDAGAAAYSAIAVNGICCKEPTNGGGGGGGS